MTLKRNLARSITRGNADFMIKWAAAAGITMAMAMLAAGIQQAGQLSSDIKGIADEGIARYSDLFPLVFILLGSVIAASLLFAMFKR